MFVFLWIQAFLFFLSLVYWRSLLLYSSLQSSQTPICQHGCANSSGYLHSLHLLTDRPNSGHGREGQSKPHHVLRHTTDALCLHLTGTLAGTDSQGLSHYYCWYLWHLKSIFKMLKCRTSVKFVGNCFVCCLLQHRARHLRLCPSWCLYKQLRPQWSLSAVTSLFSGTYSLCSFWLQEPFISLVAFRLQHI